MVVSKQVYLPGRGMSCVNVYERGPEASLRPQLAEEDGNPKVHYLCTGTIEIIFVAARRRMQGFVQ